MKKISSIIIFLHLFSTSVIAEHYNFVTLQYPPLSYTEKNEVTGIAVDLVKTVMKNMGHTVDINLYPWARALSKTKQGDADAIFTAYKNPEREIFLDYSNIVLIPQTVSLYVLKNSKINFDGDLLKLKHHKIAVVSTISYGKSFDSVKNRLTLQRAETLEKNFERLKLKRVDIVISNIYTGDATLKKIGYEYLFKKLDLPVQTVNSFIAFSKTKRLETLRDEFDVEFQKIIETGTYSKIIAGYNVSK